MESDSKRAVCCWCRSVEALPIRAVAVLKIDRACIILRAALLGPSPSSSADLLSAPCTSYLLSPYSPSNPEDYYYRSRCSHSMISEWKWCSLGRGGMSTILRRTTSPTALRKHRIELKLHAQDETTSTLRHSALPLLESSALAVAVPTNASLALNHRGRGGGTRGKAAARRGDIALGATTTSIQSR